MHYFYLNIAKTVAQINKSRSNNKKVAKFGDKTPKLATLLMAEYWKKKLNRLKMMWF